MGQATQTFTLRTEVGDVRPRAFFRKPYNYANIRYYDYTDTKLHEWCSHIEDPPGRSSAGTSRPTSTTGGHPLIARSTRGYKRPTTEYNNKSSQTTLKVMQWNAEGIMRKKTELEHRMNKANIDICCIQETHL